MWLQGDGQDEHMDEQDEKIDLDIELSHFTFICNKGDGKYYVVCIHTQI